MESVHPRDGSSRPCPQPKQDEPDQDVTTCSSNSSNNNTKSKSSNLHQTVNSKLLQQQAITANVQLIQDPLSQQAQCPVVAVTAGDQNRYPDARHTSHHINGQPDVTCHVDGVNVVDVQDLAGKQSGAVGRTHLPARPLIQDKHSGSANLNRRQQDDQLPFVRIIPPELRAHGGQSNQGMQGSVQPEVTIIIQASPPADPPQTDQVNLAATRTISEQASLATHSQPAIQISSNPIAKQTVLEPQVFSSKKTQKYVIKMPDGSLYEVANPPEKSKDDSSLTKTNGQLSRTGSLTVLKRTGPGGPRRSSGSTSRTPSQSSLDAQSYASAVDLSCTDKLPPIDTPEASHVCSIRLKHILKKLQKDELSKEDLIKNLTYAASVLETVYIDETRNDSNQLSSTDSAYDSSRGTSPNVSPARPPAPHGQNKPNYRRLPSRRLCDEDDELSEVEPDAVPSEVRDWLALTFTRSMSNMKRRGDEKPKFRSVANAIRAGIMVDRIYRRMSSTVGLHIPPSVILLLKNMGDWSFDVFAVNEQGDGNALKYVGYELLQRYDLINKFKINAQTLETFLTKLQQGYSKHDNPYHNLIHAADVTQTTHHIISQSGLAVWLTDLEIFATLIAAMIHDYEHTGTTNNFHINTCSEVALLYNDKAVLENYHVSTSFRLLREDDHNILSNLKREEYRDFRSLVIDMVLATDMSYHFQQIKNMKNLLSMPENIDKSKALSLVLHCADISHPAKDWDLHHRWTQRLIEEFFRQGDREAELGLPISPLCDRNNTLVAESQIGFIDFIVDPSFQVMGDMLVKITAPLQQRNTISEEGTEKADKATSTTSLSSRCSTPSSPRSTLSSSSASMKFSVKRFWEDCLVDNKLKWKEKAAKEVRPGSLQPEKTNSTQQRPQAKVASIPRPPISLKKDAEIRQQQLQEAANGEDKKSDDQDDSGVESPNIHSKETKSAEKFDVATDTVIDAKDRSSDKPPTEETIIRASSAKVSCV